MKCNPVGNTLQFTFDGQESFTFDAAQYRHLWDQAAMHGFEQKLRDNAAIARKQKDGTIITVTEAMRREAVVEMAESLKTAWNTRVAKVAPPNAAITALAASRGKTYAEAEAWIAEQAMADMDK